MTKEDIRRYSLVELEEMVARGSYVPTRPDATEYELERDFWRNARVVRPNRQSIRLPVDLDVLDWFKAQGPGYLAHMNDVLRIYMKGQTAAVKPLSQSTALYTEGVLMAAPSPPSPLERPFDTQRERPFPMPEQQTRHSVLQRDSTDGWERILGRGKVTHQGSQRPLAA